MATDVCRFVVRNKTRNGDFAIHRAYLKMETAKGRENFSYVEFKTISVEGYELYGEAPLRPCVT